MSISRYPTPPPPPVERAANLEQVGYTDQKVVSARYSAEMGALNPQMVLLRS